MKTFFSWKIHKISTISSAILDSLKNKGYINVGIVLKSRDKLKERMLENNWSTSEKKEKKSLRFILDKNYSNSVEEFDVPTYRWNQRSCN